jgi:DNA polymerase-3 subunit beta
MKAIIKKTDLVDTVKTVMPAVSSRSTLPVLEMILLKVEEGLLSASATNLSIGIRKQTTPLRIEEEGAICLPARAFSELISAATSDELKLETNEKTMALTLTSGKSKSQLKGISPDEFPPMLEPKGEGAIMDGKIFVEAIQKTAFSASTEEGKPTLQGISIAGDENFLVFTATDGYRLSSLQRNASLKLQVLIPASNLKMVSRLAGTDEFQIKHNVNQVIFKGSDWMAISQIIDGQYPDYRAVTPKTFKTQVTTRLVDLRTAVRQARVFTAGEQYYPIKLSINGAMKISSQSEEMGDFETELECTLEGPEQEIAFNCGFLEEVLAVMDSEIIEMHINKSTSPCLFKMAGRDDFQHILMPISK